MARTKSEGKRRTILDAAETAFARKEFDEVLTDDVAALAGVGKGTLYRYFPTKEELYSAALLRGFEELERDLAELDAGPASAADGLGRVCRGMLLAFWSRSGLLHAVRGFEADAGPTRRELRARRELVHAVLVRVLREGVERGELRAHDPWTAAQLFIGMIRSAIVFRRADDTVDGLANEILAVFLRGVGAREAS